MNTINATSRVSQSNTRAAQKMMTLRPLDGGELTKSGVLMQTIYDTQQVASGSFINSYGQVSLKSLQV
jgi:hypothetical protein